MPEPLLLLVDDGNAFRDGYRELLEGDGYAGTAPAALSRFKSSGARLVVLDLMLPPSGRPEEGAALAARLLAARSSAPPARDRPRRPG
jgi:CheY-like chemotaxis protein